MRWSVLMRGFALISALGCGGDGLESEADAAATAADSGSTDASPASDAAQPAPLDGAPAGEAPARADAGAEAGGDRPRDAAAKDGASNERTDGASAPAANDAGSDAESPTPAGYRLIWSDEFDGPANSLPSPDRWVFETGGNGFGNNQLEFDTARPENASLDGKGQLVLTARKESYMGRSYTSARLKTQGKFERAYGRFEARMRLPQGQGIWPAFWMLGRDIGTAGWPACGEIDIMENIGREPARIHGTLHGPGYSGGSAIGAPYDLPSGMRFATDYHVFAIEWETDRIRWFVDGTLYQTRTPRDLPGGAKWVYDHPFFILLNLAVGGQWPGSPDATTQFPQQLAVDYVRVYERSSPPAP